MTTPAAAAKAASFSIRPFVDADFDEIARISRETMRHSAITGEELRHADATRDPKCYSARFVAELPTGEMIGTGSGFQMAEVYHPDKYIIHCRVMPEFRNRGIGSALYEAAVADLSARNPVAYHTRAFEDDEPSLRFAMSRGYVEDMREWLSILNVAEARLADIDDPAADLESSGIHLTTLADRMRRDTDWARRMYDMDMSASVDVPTQTPFTPWSFESYEAEVLGSPSFIPEGIFLAIDGERYVGMSVLHRRNAPGELDTGFTGVIREYRRRGIALALKLMAVRFARDNGCRRIYTMNATTNRPMLAINEMLGFEKEPAMILFTKELTADAESKAGRQ